MGEKRLGPGLEHGSGFSLTWSAQKVINRQDIVISTEDKRVLRELAKKVAELAAHPREEQKKILWTKHNDLENTRPLILCEPQNSWYEIIPPDTLGCKGGLAKIYEFKLRKDIYRCEVIKDDTVVSDEFPVQYVFTESGRGKSETIIKGENDDSCYTWDPAISDYSELDEMYFNEFTVDFDKTKKLFELMQDVLGDILKVKMEGSWWWSLGMTWDLVYLIGMDKMMMDMFDDPDGIHKAMKFLHDEKMAQINFASENNLYTLNNNELYLGSGGFGWTNDLPQKDFDPARVRTQDLWVFAESQETVGISPAMFEEFIYPYQLSLMEKFGLIYYGCCESIHERWDIVKETPNLRRVSVSPWSDEDMMAEYLGDNYVYVRKTPPTWVTQSTIDENEIREGLGKTIQLAKKNNCNLELFMKDTHTVSNNPNNLIRYIEIAREMTEDM